jgi:hypothetical protein
MIEDENGIQRPWSIIPRPERMPKNPRIREIMELGLGSNAEPEADLPNDDETTKAQKAIYRGIWVCVSLLFLYHSTFTRFEQISEWN